MIFDNNTRIYGLLGRNVGYSLSSLIHNFIFHEAGVNAVYHLFDIGDKPLKRAIDSIKTLNISGVNVTTPFKEEILPYLNDFNPEVEILQSVNTVYLKGGQLLGFNTDINGFVKQLKENNINIENENVLILGSGGVAKALVLGLLMRHENLDIVLIGRNQEKVFQIKKMVEEKLDSSLICSSLDNIDFYIEDRTLLINATPLGGVGLEQELAFPEKFIDRTRKIVDLNYITEKSILRKTCERKMSDYYDSLDMLIFQAMESQKLWLGIDADFQIVKDFILKKREVLCWNI